MLGPRYKQNHWGWILFFNPNSMFHHSKMYFNSYYLLEFVPEDVRSIKRLLKLQVSVWWVCKTPGSSASSRTSWTLFTAHGEAQVLRGVRSLGVSKTLHSPHIQHSLKLRQPLSGQRVVTDKCHRAMKHSPPHLQWRGDTNNKSVIEGVSGPRGKTLIWCKL